MRNRGSKWRTGARILVAVAILSMANEALSQSITLTGPSSNVILPDGDDFATDALGYPWSMDRLRDFAMDYGFANPAIVSGTWQAPSIESLAFCQPLFTGYSSPTYTMYFTRYDNGTPYGPLNPIESDKYTRLSMRTSLPAGARSFTYVFWTDNYAVGPASGVAIEDTKPAVAGFRMYDISLLELTGPAALEDKDAQLRSTQLYIGTRWRNETYGLMLRPAESMPFNTLHKVDWVRVYDPVTSPKLTIFWNTSGIPSSPGYGVNLYVDTDASGYNGDLFISGLANDGGTQINTAALPPGIYYFYLKAVRLVGGSVQELATSGYSARLTIGAPPAVTIEAPSMTSGQDYATTELGNPWDMSSAADVATLSDVYFPTYPGVLNAMAGTVDPQVWLNTRKNGLPVSIDPNKYRYLTFRMWADDAGTVNFTGRMQAGWVARLVWWRQGANTDGTVSKDIPVLEGWHAYTVDLWDGNLVETAGSTGTPQLGWRALTAGVNGLRIDPLEVFASTWFKIDDVKLCAENKPINGSYTLRWTVADADSGACDVRVYYGYDTVGGFVEVPTPLVTRTQVAPGPDSFTWNLAGMPNGNYHLRVEVDDGLNTRSFVSDVPIVIDDSIPRMNIAGMDPTIYYRPKGWWVTLHADGSGYDKVPWGHPLADPVPADYDGDGLTDRAVFHAPTGRWYIQESSTGNMMGGGPIVWGPGARPVPADYDGDDHADQAVYAPSDGKWYIRYSNGGTATVAWGPYAEPAPGDYDDDGLADVAVYAPSDSKWYVLSSVTGKLLNNTAYAVGTPGSIPVPADYDGDGITDMATYAPATGKWTVRQSSTGTLMGNGAIQWGWAGVAPVPGDFNNDGKCDIVVFNPADGYWSFRFTGGGTTAGGPWGWRGNNSEPIAGEFWR